MSVKPYDGKFFVVKVSAVMSDWWAIDYISSHLHHELIELLERQIEESVMKTDEFDLFEKSGEYVFAITLCDDGEYTPDLYWEFTRLSFKQQQSKPKTI